MQNTGGVFIHRTNLSRAEEFWFCAPAQNVRHVFGAQEILHRENVKHFLIRARMSTLVKNHKIILNS